MSDTKFTKGEWVIGQVDGQFAIMRHDTGYGICSTVMCDETDQANAHLIAAAPEMYEILEAIYITGMMPTGAKLKKLLAKARGE